jgi:hypothetical protein
MIPVASTSQQFNPEYNPNLDESPENPKTITTTNVVLTENPYERDLETFFQNLTTERLDREAVERGEKRDRDAETSEKNKLQNNLDQILTQGGIDLLSDKQKFGFDLVQQILDISAGLENIRTTGEEERKTQHERLSWQNIQNYLDRESRADILEQQIAGELDAIRTRGDVESSAEIERRETRLQALRAEHQATMKQIAAGGKEQRLTDAQAQSFEKLTQGAELQFRRQESANQRSFESAMLGRDQSFEQSENALDRLQQMAQIGAMGDQERRTLAAELSNELVKIGAINEDQIEQTRINFQNTLSEIAAQAQSQKDIIEAQTASIIEQIGARGRQERQTALTEWRSRGEEERRTLGMQQDFQRETILPHEQQLEMMKQIVPLINTLSQPGIASILGLVGGGGIAPVLQPALNQAGVMGQAGAPIFNALPTASYMQQIGPSAAQGLQALTGFAGLDPGMLSRIIGSVTPGGAQGLLPATAQTSIPTGLRR